MKDKKIFILLLILPVTLFYLSNFFTDIYSPYYLNYHHDPSYAYLLNSLNLASGHFAGHVEHPGTPLQLLGAAVMKIYFCFTGISHDITSDVLDRPETYLRIINIVVLILNSITLFFLGLCTYKIYRELYQALFIQLIPFFSINIFTEFSDVNAESVISIPLMLLVIYSLKFINLIEPDRKTVYKYVFIFSLITGLGISIKLIFLPLIFIPLILLKDFTKKIAVLFLTVVSFLIFVIPGIINYRYFFEWVNKLFFKSGIYGGGESNVVDPLNFIHNLRTIVLSEKLFVLTYLIILVFLVYSFFKYRRSGNDVRDKFLKSELDYRLLTGIFLSVSFGIVAVSKHYVTRYMMSSLMLCIPLIFIFLIITQKINFFDFNKFIFLKKYIFIILIFLIVILNFRKYKLTYEDELFLKMKSTELHNVIQNNYPDATVISGHLCFNDKKALHFGTAYTGRMNPIYKNLLGKKYPEQIIYKGPANEMYKLSRDTNISEVLMDDRKIIFHSNKYNSHDSLISKIKRDYDFSNVGYKSVFKNDFDKNEEELFEIIIER